MSRKISFLSIAVVMLLVVATRSWAGPWIPLFDGVSFNGWSTLGGDPVPTGAWEVDDGTMHLDVSQGQGGDIVTDRDYGDFELVFEWKIAHRANNGIKYRVKNFDGRVLGCEYQIIDDVYHDTLRAIHTTASLYDVYPSQAGAVLHPPGEFNRGAIIVCGNRIQHWLNGRLLVNAVVGSNAWERRIASSKFSGVDGFGKNRLGRIMLTDHGGEVWYRNVFLRPLGNGQTTWSETSCRPRRVRLVRSWKACRPFAHLGR